MWLLWKQNQDKNEGVLWQSATHMCKYPIEGCIVSVLYSPCAELALALAGGEMIWASVTDLGEKWRKTKRYSMFSAVFLISQVCPDVLYLPQQLRHWLGIVAQLLPAAAVCQRLRWLRTAWSLREKMSISLLSQRAEYWLLRLEEVVTVLLNNFLF